MKRGMSRRGRNSTRSGNKDDNEMHEQQGRQDDGHVAQRRGDADLADCAGDQEAQTVWRRDEAEGKADHHDQGEVDRVHAAMLCDREQHRAEDDDRRYGVDEAADDEEGRRDQQAEANRPVS